MKRCRRVAGSLIRDLSLLENLCLEPLLGRRVPDASVIRDFEALFQRAGHPVTGQAWADTLPGQASAIEVLQVRVGCALMGDPDILEIELDSWDPALLPPEALSVAFRKQFPWRELRWLATPMPMTPSMPAMPMTPPAGGLVEASP